MASPTLAQLVTMTDTKLAAIIAQIATLKDDLQRTTRLLQQAETRKLVLDARKAALDLLAQEP